MTRHAQHQMHDNSLAVHYRYLDKHLSLRERCYAYIQWHPNVTDEDVARALLGAHARRQDVAPRITELIRQNRVKESGGRVVNKVTVRTLEPVIELKEQLSLIA